MNIQRHTIKSYAKTDEENDSPLTQSLQLKFLQICIAEHYYYRLLDHNYKSHEDDTRYRDQNSVEKFSHQVYLTHSKTPCL